MKEYLPGVFLTQMIGLSEVTSVCNDKNRWQVIPHVLVDSVSKNDRTCELRTVDCGLWTADYGLGINRGLRTADWV